MSVSGTMRQVHRWLSAAFTAGVLTYIAAMWRGRPPGWVGLLTAVPLILLLVSGLYLFALPYVSKWRALQRRRGMVVS